MARMIEHIEVYLLTDESESFSAEPHSELYLGFTDQGHLEVTVATLVSDDPLADGPFWDRRHTVYREWRSFVLSTYEPVGES